MLDKFRGSYLPGTKYKIIFDGTMPVKEGDCN